MPMFLDGGPGWSPKLLGPRENNLLMLHLLWGIFYLHVRPCSHIIQTNVRIIGSELP
jgi:hypothetical protein